MTKADANKILNLEDVGEATEDRMMRIFAIEAIVAAILALFIWTRDPANLIKYLILHWSVAVMAAVWIWAVWKSPKRAVASSLPGMLLLLFLALNLVAALASSHVVNSLQEWRKLAVPAALYLFAAAAYRTPRHARGLFIAVCVATALSSVYGFCQRLGWDPVPWTTRAVEEYRNLPATFGNPNMASHTLNLAFIVALFLTSRKGTRWCALPALLIGSHIMFTGVRAAKVALVGAALCGAIIWLLGRMGAGKRPVRAALATILALFVLAVAGLGAGAALTKARTGSYLPLDRSVLLRYNSFVGAANMIMDRPVLGFGPGNYYLENPPYWTQYERDRFATKPLINTHVHNDYLEAAVEAGFGGAILYIGFLLSAFFYSLVLAFGAADPERRRLGAVLAACLLCFSIDGLFGFNVRVPASAALLFLFAGVLRGQMLAEWPSGKTANPAVSRGLAVALLLLAVVMTYWDTRGFLAQVNCQRARGAVQHKMLKQAYASLERAEKLTPWDPDIPREMAVLDLNTRQSDRAVEHMQRVLSLHPHDVKAHVGLSWAHTNRALQAQEEGQPAEVVLDRLNEAQAAAKGALSIVPRLPEAHESLGKVALLRARSLEGQSGHDAEVLEAREEARSHLKDALRYGTLEAAKTWLLLAEVCEGLGQDDEAAEAFAKALAAAPASEDNWTRYMAFVRRTGRWAEAGDHLSGIIRKLEKEEGETAGIRILLLEALAECHARGSADIPAAEAALVQALKLNPTRLDIWGAYAGLFEPDARPGAILALGATISADPSLAPDVPALAKQVAAGAQEGGAALVAAVDALRKAVQETRPKAPTDAMQRGFSWAVEMLSHAVAVQSVSESDRGGVLHALGFSCLVMEAWPQAEALLGQALHALPEGDRPAGLMHLSEAQLQLGKIAEAIESARGAALARNDWPQARLQLARALVRGNRTAEARLEYESLLRTFTFPESDRNAIQAELDALSKGDAGASGG